MNQTTAWCLCAPASAIVLVLMNRDEGLYGLRNPLSPLFLSCRIHDEKSTFGAGVRRKGLNGVASPPVGSAETGHREQPFRGATLVYRQLDPGKHAEKPPDLGRSTTVPETAMSASC